MKILSVNNQYADNQPSFGSFSKSAKHLINRYDVRTFLEREHDVTYKEIRKMDESAIKFSLLSEVVPELAPTAGLYVLPPKGSRLPALSLTKPDINLNGTHSTFFAGIVKKAIELEEVYRGAIKDFGKHPISRKYSRQILKMEENVKKTARQFVHAYNSGDKTEMQKLSSFLTQNDKHETRLTETCAAKCESAHEKLVETVVPQWEDITAQTLTQV